MKIKRLMSFFLAAVMSMSTLSWLSLLPAAAEENATDTPVNYAEGLAWNKQVGTPAVSVTDTGAVMSGLANSWDSVGCDILPALKKALGDDERVYLSLSVEVTATMKAGSEGDTLTARVLMRGTDTRSDLGDSAWNSAYADALGWDPSLFFKQGGNVMSYLNGGLSLKHGKAVVYTTTLELTKNQIECGILTEWIFCVDNLGGMNMSNVEGVEFKNLTIVKTEKPSVDEGESFDPDPVDPNNTDHLITAYRGEVWSPVEILLRSTVDYANPYVETEIDATFTHTDGTVITIPGFWMGGNTWAVRFSPTKAGEWSYKITCSDKSNQGLSKTGTVTASRSSKTTGVSQHGFVTVEKGEHYYKHADGTPFFWLGDTNWQAFSNVSTTVCNYPGCQCGSQFEHIVNDRVAKGFTVYQTYFVTDAGNGEPSVWKDSRYDRPATGVFNDKIDHMFEYLHEQGMTVALGLGCHTQTPGAMELEDFLRFTRYVVARYGCYSIVWISGQEINIEGKGKTPGYTSFDYYMNASALIEELDGYKHPNSAHMWPITADHADAVRLDQAPWHDSWTVQGGHCSVRPKAYYESYYKANGSGFHKPFVEAEANYEDINCGGFTGYDLNRLSAWTAMLCGSAGFTYGTTGIWANSFSTSGFTGWYGATSSFSYDPWYMGLDKPGSFEVGYMKQFFTDIGPWQDLIPCFSDRDVSPTLHMETVSMAATEDRSLLVAYFYDAHRTAKIKVLDPAKTYDVYWFNPRTGKYIPVEKGLIAKDGSYTVSTRPDANDWVLLITALGLADHYEEDLPEDLNPTYEQVAPTGTKVTPISVKAVGGISYSGAQKDAQTMTDHTAWLWDGNPATVWKPVADRSTQTFIFDLGKAHKLTHVNITPAEGTIIPTFRVEGSNDGKIWTVITDTPIRDAKNPGAASEPLAGTYRYVKILLRNADTLHIGEDQLSSLPYKAMYNPATFNCYSVTEISDITIYSDGEGEPTPDRFVTDTPATDPEQGTDETTEPITDAPVEDTEAPTAEPPSEKKGCKSALSGMTLAAVAAAGATVCARRRKED